MCSDSVLKLGEKIVAEFDLDKSSDTLGRWMAHYVAEKIEEVESATGQDRAIKLSACADEILKLWAHRSKLPSGKRPFEDLESIFNSLRSLDPHDTTPRYFRQIRLAAEEDEETSETVEWLDLASWIDSTARILIRYCLVAAAQTTFEKSKEWVDLASKADRGEDLDIKIARILIKDAETFTPKTAEDLKREEIEGLVEKLEAFAEMANGLLSHLSSILNVSNIVVYQPTPQVIQLLKVVKGDMDRFSLQSALSLGKNNNFRLLYLVPALEAGLLEMTIPDKPRSSKQLYRLSEKGKQVLEETRKLD